MDQNLTDMCPRDMYIRIKFPDTIAIFFLLQFPFREKYQMQRDGRKDGYTGRRKLSTGGTVIFDTTLLPMPVSCDHVKFSRPFWVGLKRLVIHRKAPPPFNSPQRPLRSVYTNFCSFGCITHISIVVGDRNPLFAIFSRARRSRDR